MKMIPVNRRVRAQIPNLFLATLAISLLSLALPIMTLQVYDRILPNPDSGTLPVLLAGVCVAVVLEICLRLARGYVVSWNGAAYEHETACRAVDHMLQSNLAIHRASGTGEHLNRINAINRLKDFNSGYLQVTLFELLMIPLFLALIYYIAGWLVLVPLAVMALFGALVVAAGGRLLRALEAREDADERRYDFLLETLTGIHTIKAFCLENSFNRRYEYMEKDSTAANYRVTRDVSSGFNTGTVFSNIMIVCVITVGAMLVLGGQMSSGGLIASILLSGRIMQPMQRALALWVRYQDYSVGQARLRQVFDTPLVRTDYAIDEPERAGHISLRRVGFIYPRASKFLFENVDLDVRAGEAVRITGVYGSGKSTILALIAGLYEAEAGQVLVDGLPPMRYPPGTLCRHVGLLSTQGAIFRGSIRDNITRYGIVGEEDARRATRLLEIDKAIAGLPRGFDTPMGGANDSGISPGLQQRIAMARVMAAQPRVILFDNADRNLDRNGYRAVYRMLAAMKPKVALVLVSDDQNFAKLADRHYRLDHAGLYRLARKNSDEAREIRA